MDKKIGIDVGNVLTQRKAGRIRPFAGTDYLKVKSFEGSFQAVKELVGMFSPKNTFLVSRCDLENQPRVIAWLHHMNIFAETGLLEENVHFCLKRSEKRAIAEELQLNYFIDDRWSVLVHLTQLSTMNVLYLLKPFPEEKALFQDYEGEKVILVDSWYQIVADLKKRHQYR